MYYISNYVRDTFSLEDCFKSLLKHLAIKRAILAVLFETLGERF
jgi:hypothetical protein